MKNNLNKLLKFEPASVDLSAGSVIGVSDRFGSDYPFCFESNNGDTLLYGWMNTNKELLNSLLNKHGAILFRNFNKLSIQSFNDFTKQYGKHLINYSLGAAKRTKIIDSVYFSTHHPADEYLEMHNEMSYTNNFPDEIMFYCNIAAEHGGETPIADCRQIAKFLSFDVKEKFRALGIMYVRQLGGVLGGLSWQEVFMTEDPALVEQTCKKNDIDIKWNDSDSLVMTWKLNAFKIHPITKEEVWFNHAFFFNSIFLKDDLYRYLKKEDMPFVALYGDRTEIEIETLEEIGIAFEKSKCSFTWTNGDLLLLDNLLMSHGRNSFSGSREILVAMFKNGAP